MKNIVQILTACAIVSMSQGIRIKDDDREISDIQQSIKEAE